MAILYENMKLSINCSCGQRTNAQQEGSEIGQGTRQRNQRPPDGGFKDRHGRYERPREIL